MQFPLIIVHDRRKYQVNAEILLLTAEKEQYKITSRYHSIVLQSNRPLWRNKGLKKRKPDWKVVEGKSSNPDVIQKIIEELMKKIDTP